MTSQRWTPAIALLALVLSAGIAAAAARIIVGSGVATPPAPPPRPRAAPFVPASVDVAGRLSATAAAVMPTTGPRGGVIAVVRVDDIKVCEDLGRQLRLVRRAVGPAKRLVLTGEARDTAVLRRFARNERLGAVDVIPLEPGQLLDGTAPLPTPALLVMSPDGRITAGVAHPQRFANARLRSFDAELALALRGVRTRDATAQRHATAVTQQ